MCTVKVTVQLAGSCRRMGGADGHLEQWVGFTGVLLENEILVNKYCYADTNFTIY